CLCLVFFFSSRRRHTRLVSDWSSDVCSSDLGRVGKEEVPGVARGDEFSGPRATPGTSSFPTRPSIERIDRIHWEGRHLLMNLLRSEERRVGKGGKCG